MKASIRTYSEDNGLIVFEQSFPSSLTGEPCLYPYRHFLLMRCVDDLIGIEHGQIDYLSDREASGNNSDIYSNAFGNLRGGGVPGVDGTTNACRVVTGEFKLTSSRSGYDAYEPSGSSFTKHAGEYCGMGTQTHAPAAFDGNLDLADCQTKCTELKCKCFDHHNG